MKVMEKTVKIPFYKNHGWQCGPRCAAMILKYYRPEIKIDWKKFARIMHHCRPRTWTFTQQLGLLLDHYGLKTKVFSREKLQTTREDPEQFHRAFGKDYLKLIKQVDIEDYDWSLRMARRRRLIVCRSTKFSEIINLFQKGCLVIFPVDWNILNHKSGAYEGHFVVLSGLKKGGQALIHDPDMGPHQSYSVKTLNKAYKHPVITDDLIVVCGRK